MFMKIGIGADHRGYKTKQKIVKYLKKKNYEVIDFGCDTENSTDDYIDYAYLVCKSVLNGEVERGILVCGTGIGMSIVANKMKGIMCAKVDNYKEARLAIEHNQANVISLSASKSFMDVKDMLDEYLTATPLEEERYYRRIDKLKKIESKRTYK